jgi:ABC-2 type transport system ATP-binding protein
MNRSDTPMIEAVDLSKRYADGTLALDALNLKVAAGEIYCLLGAPGAGKSTAIRLFLDFTPPTSGQALVAGVDAARRPREAKAHLAYLMAGATFYEHLTALGNVAFFARLAGRHGLSRRDYAMALREVGLAERSFKVRVKHFSAGMRQKLGLAVAIVKDAPVLLLDEPTAGLDAQSTAEILEILGALRERGKAVLLATQDLFQAKQLADRVGILREGRLVLTFSREELRRQNLEAIYLDYMRGGTTRDDGRAY